MERYASNRWFVLAVLFAARVTMAFQFQAVAALSPVYMTAFGVELSDIGFLIGLYLAPGLVFALPGGAIGRRFGDRRVIAFGMVLMLTGAVIMFERAQLGGPDRWPADGRHRRGVAQRVDVQGRH